MIPTAWHPDARAEFLDALTRSSDPVAFRRDADATLADLASGLVAGNRVPRSPCREVVMTRLPYRVIYLQEPTALRVIAFAHHKRRSGYWKSRLRRP